MATAVLVLTGLLLFMVGTIYLLPQAYRLLQVRRWNRQRGLLALTYDDGPDPVTTPALLDLLDELGAPATFYLTGFRAEGCPEVIERLRGSRHELGTHAHFHWHGWRISPLREYRNAMAGYRTLAGVVAPDAPFRPTFGKITLPTLLGMWRRGRRVDWWSIPTNDTDDEFEDPGRLARSILDRGKTVVLMHCHHDEPHRRAFILATTRALVEQARERRIELVTMAGLTTRLASAAP
ncbi:MAG: polysaccharide deacetylase family protein [Pseudomonadales bacterium]|nr:polysaccharide deacetylase family protein [Pseudomonadales bacterium]